MDKELKRRWVEALRSGNYKQGHKGLRKKEEFCCLGVLADVGDPEGWQKGTIDRFTHRHVNPQERGELDLSFGLSRSVQRTLWKMNDYDLLGFPAIADHIEKRIKGS